jgi:small subunit ribosomal protein S17
MDTQTHTPGTSTRRVLRGKVVSTKMQDTIAVQVDRYVMHPKYKKFMRRTKKYLVHDKGNTATLGDSVEIRETRPLSKRKHFELITNHTQATK